MSGVIISGMHHSGTSVVAGLLRSAGCEAGQTLMPVDQQKGYNFFENSEFVGLNQKWLSIETSQEELPNDWGLVSGELHEYPWDASELKEARAFGNRQDENARDWIVKDPRSSLTLPIWSKVPNLRFLFVYRNPWDVTDSLMKYGHPFSGEADWARKAWKTYNERILDMVKQLGPRCMVVSSSAVLRDPDVFVRTFADWAEMSLQSPNTEEIIDRNRFKDRPEGSHISRLFRILHPKEASVLDQLDQVATIPRKSAPPSNSLVTPAGSQKQTRAIQIIIPCKNDAQYLDECIASVEVSAGSVSWPVELTVVDNASTDEVSKEAFKLLSAAGYQVILEKRTGPSAARNKGLKLSRAKAVVPLDADNRILPALLLGAEGILDGTADIAYGPWRRFGLDSRIVYPPENIDWTALMPHNTIDNCAIVSRKLLDSLGGWKENIFGYEDWDLWLRALRKKARFLNLKEVTFEYLVRPGSMTSGFQADPDSLQTAYLRVFNKHKRRLQMKKLWSRLSS